MRGPRTSRTLFDDPRAAWEPYRPGPDASWDAARVAHLHRRAGLGATWSQLRRDVREGFEPSIQRVLQGEARGPGGQPAAEFVGNRLVPQRVAEDAADHVRDTRDDQAADGQVQVAGQAEGMKAGRS